MLAATSPPRPPQTTSTQVPAPQPFPASWLVAESRSLLGSSKGCAQRAACLAHAFPAPPLASAVPPLRAPPPPPFNPEHLQAST
jgi:hypothetical protein